MKFQGRNNEFVEIVDITPDNCRVLNESRENELSLLWFVADGNQLVIDTVEYTFNTNDIVSLTEFHEIKATRITGAQLIRWNRSFYCIIDHDSQVGCKGVLYYGASRVPVIKPGAEDMDVFETTMKMFRIEMESRDNLQLEMLQMMLKRFIILCTRIYKSQQPEYNNDPGQVELLRSYNYLVEEHFKEKHTVKEYADLLSKSPKTLANLFKKRGGITPLQYIHNRIMLEARRMLVHSDKSVSEIGYHLGFSDVQVFSRFFKKEQGCSPQFFREREVLTTQ
ncbi:MAG: helix-turn-helix transcriptional regulator [Bacteroidia bacterium]|nr:helix-turn-helix transcriptional regulator [Bacteroidia bacterium]